MNSERKEDAYHIGRCKVTHDELVLARLEDFSDLVGNFLHAHLGFFVVGGDFRRGDHESFLVRELFLNSSVEEECHVRVFLRF